MTTPRRQDFTHQDRVSIPLDVASHAATTTVHFHKVPAFVAGFVLESVDYINPTGLTGDASNAFDIEVKDGSTSMAKYSTLSSAQGTITADTFTTVPLSVTPANLQAAPSDVLALVLTLHGTQTLPAGRIVLHGRYL